MKFEAQQYRSSWIMFLCLVLVIGIIYKTPAIVSGENPVIRPTISAPSDPMTFTSRLSYNLIYWTPHKTGSTSMRGWLRLVGSRAEVKVKLFGYYPYSDFTNWHERAGPRNCSILAGHIRTTEKRDHEGSLGAVVTTSRNPMDTFASKYFHRTSQWKNDIPSLSSNSSMQSRYWFFYFNDIDPCEQLRYYDGKDGCAIETLALKERSRRIAERVDCVVDTDDPDEDLAGICRMMNIQECPQFPVKNTGNSQEYEDMFQHAHLVNVMQRVIRVGNILREELLKRRCRVLVRGDELTKPGVPKPQWPHKGCVEAEL